MDPNPQNLATLAQLLQQTLSADISTRKTAETTLQGVETTPGFPICLLTLLQPQQNVPAVVQSAAAVYFKNLIKKHWHQVEGEADKITQQDRIAIKSSIVPCMLACPKNVQLQLSEAVTLIADNDFPEKWENLLPDLISKLSPTDWKTNKGVLATAHSIFGRWRSQFRSNALFTEIKFVLQQFTTPYMELFKMTDAALSAGGKEDVWECFVLLLQVFYDLNCQEIPEFFEDNIKPFCAWFKKYLEVAPLDNDDDDEPDLVTIAKTHICEIIDLYTKRYEDVFGEYLPEFVQTVWNLLTTVGAEPKYDLLVSKALAFLTSVSKPERHRALFASPQTLQQICEKVVLPNMVLRSTDLEDFQDDPLGYVRRELEGSDAETRRRAAGDLVRGLLEHFEKQVTEIFGKYVSSYLSAYGSNPQKNYLQKDTALYLLTSLSARSVTASTGATKINQHIRTLDVFTTNILPDLQDDDKEWQKGGGVNPIVKVGSLKYILMFRTQLSRQDLLGIMPFLVHHLDHPNPVVYTYAAVCIERILAMKHPMTGKLEFGSKDIISFAPSLLEKLFGLIERSGSALQPAKLAENDYLMKCIMRTVMTLRADVVPFAQQIISKLTSIIGVISANPSNPKFNHYAFETLGGMVRFVCPGNPQAVAQFEQLLMPSFQQVLSHDVQEFMPYVFQILSQLLEFHENIPDVYQGIFPTLLQPALWDSHGNIPPLVRLLQAYLEKGGKDIASSGKLAAILGIYQKLIASKLNDQHGFELLTSIFDHVPPHDLQSYLKNILVLMLNRLQATKTAKFIRGFLLWCMHVVSLPKFGPEQFLKLFDSIQPNLFVGVLQGILIPEIPQVVSMEERNIVTVGMVHLIPHLMMNKAYHTALTPLLSSLANLLIVPEAQDAGNEFEDELAALEMEESQGYQASFTRLATVGKKKKDAGDGKAMFKQEFAKWMGSSQDMKQVVAGMDADSFEALKTVTGMQ